MVFQVIEERQATRHLCLGFQAGSSPFGRIGAFYASLQAASNLLQELGETVDCFSLTERGRCYLLLTADSESALDGFWARLTESTPELREYAVMLSPPPSGYWRVLSPTSGHAQAAAMPRAA